MATLPLLPARARALRQLKLWLADGTIANGDRLPAELELAKRLVVSRRTVRAALATLADEGRIANLGLHGRFARRAREAGGTSLFAETVVVLSHMSEELSPGQLPGALLAIDAGFVQATRGAGLTPLLVHLSALSLEAAADRWRARLLNAPPAAVVFGARAFQLQTSWLERTVLELHESGIPTFAYGDEPWSRACDRVESDHDHGAGALTDWLIARGARRILRCWAPGRPGTWQQRRDQGVERALRRAGLELLPHAPPLAGDGDLELRARLQAGALIDRIDGAGEDTALLAITDSEAFACARAAELLKRPLMIAGYDNYWRQRDELRAGARPPLATVDKRNREMGAALAELCRARLAGECPPAPQLRMMEPLLVPSEPGSP
jgi:hypothetical protein